MNLAFLATGKPETALPVIQRLLARRFLYDGQIKSLQRRHWTRPQLTSNDFDGEAIDGWEIEDWAAYLENAKYEVEEGGNNEENTK